MPDFGTFWGKVFSPSGCDADRSPLFEGFRKALKAHPSDAAGKIEIRPERRRL